MRARYVYRPGHPRANHNGMVDTRDLCEVATERALDAPIMMDRFYEGARVVGTGEDIGSRRKHREYMHKNGLTTADDFTETWKQAAKEREQRQQGIFPDARERRNEVGKIWYEVEKRKNARRR